MRKMRDRSAVPDDRVVQPESAFLGQLHDDDRAERLADGSDLEQGVRPDRPPARDLGISVDASQQQVLAIGDRQDQPGDGPVRSQIRNVGVDRGDGGIQHLAMMHRAGSRHDASRRTS